MRGQERGEHRFEAWSARGLPTRVVVGAGLDDAAPTVREDSAHGPDGARHFRKTRWREVGAERVERRYAVGRFEEVVLRLPSANMFPLTASRACAADNECK